MCFHAEYVRTKEDLAATERKLHLCELRAKQEKQVMPIVGALLDELDGLDNDERQQAESVVPRLFYFLNTLRDEVENERHT